MEQHSNFFSAKILGTGSYLPQRVVTNHELSQKLKTTHEWIKERTGIEERRISDLELNQDEAPSDMGAKACLNALQSAHLNPNDIDLILVSTTLPDQTMPNTASEIQAKLGIGNLCPALDVNAACSGWVYLLPMAESLIRTGLYRHILVVAAETTSAFNNWEDRKTCILFGDGAGAIVLGRSSYDKTTILSSHLLCDSQKKDHLTLLAGGAKKRITHQVLNENQQWMKMNGQEIYKAAVKTMGQLTLEVVKKADLKIQDIDWFIPHQANLRIIKAIRERFHIPEEKVIINIHKYANTSSASVPIALDEGVRSGRISRGDLLLLATFGAGLTAGAVLLKY